MPGSRVRVSTKIKRYAVMDEAAVEAVSYHWFNVWMRDSIKLLVSQLVIRFDVDIGTSVFRRVAVFGCGED